MESNEIYPKLTEIFQDVFDDDDLELRTDLTASDVDDWDSLSHIGLIVSVEEVFDMRFPAAEVNEIENVGQFVDLIQAKLRA